MQETSILFANSTRNDSMNPIKPIQTSSFIILHCYSKVVNILTKILLV